jgi:hypothetical protein
MLRFLNIVTSDENSITFSTTDLEDDDLVVYVVFDTSTGVSTNVMEDYAAWRAITTATSTGVEFTISNSNFYPSYRRTIADYTALSPWLFQGMTLQEYDVLQDVLIRFDLVRRRLPNPGVAISSVDGVGENGTVAFTGGHEKKKSVEELMRMIAGSIIELNGAPPRTSFWPRFETDTADKINNPYMKVVGLPNDMIELIKLGALIRCLISTGIMEVDMMFSTSDSGLQLTFDRQAPVKGWHDALLQKYDKERSLFKWNHANHAGVGVGTVPWAAFGIWGTLMNNVSQGGQLALSSVLGFSARGNVPM